MRSLLHKVLGGLLAAFFALYRWVLSPLIHLISGPGYGCRFLPTCSSYGHDAIRTHGPLRGGVLTLWRVARCNPFGRSGYDPVPPLSVQKKRVISRSCSHNDGRV